MKVGIVTTWFERGAAYVSRQYAQLLEKDHEVFIYARGGESYAKGDKAWDLPNVTWGAKAIFQTNNHPVHRRDFCRWIEKNGIKVLIFNEQQWWPPILWARKMGVRVGSYVDYYTEESVPLFGVFDFLLCNTERHLSAFDWHAHAHYIPWGTDTALFVPKAKEDRDRDKVVFFNSSGYNPDRKGVRSLLKAFSRLNSDQAKLLLHTQVDLKKHYGEMRDEVENMLAAGTLEIVQETVTAPGLYYRGDVYCYLSKLDGIGLTLAEAASCGLQIITPDQPPMNEFVEPKVTGKLVKVQKTYARKDGYYWPQCEVSEEDLLRQLEWYIENAPRMTELKEVARARALEKFKWLDRAEQLNEIIEGSERVEVGEKLLGKVKEFEFRRIPYWSLVRLPYKMWQNLTR